MPHPTHRHTHTLHVDMKIKVNPYQGSSLPLLLIRDEDHGPRAHEADEVI